MYDRSRDMRPESRHATGVASFYQSRAYDRSRAYDWNHVYDRGRTYNRVGHMTEVAIQSESSYNRSHVFQLELGL
jgi:hypothetical protein